MRRIFLRDEQGATMVEMAIIINLLLVVTFGILEGGFVFWQYVSAEKATQVGVRRAAVANAVVTGAGDCGIGVTIPSTVPDGASCSDPGISGATSWVVRCGNGGLIQSSPGGGNCDSTAFNTIFTRMQEIFPRITAANVVVEFRGSGLGFVGRGQVIPVITVSLRDLTYQWIALGELIGLNDVVMPAFPATLTGEDLTTN